MKPTVIRNGRLLCPAHGLDQIADLYLPKAISWP